ncbi:MAG: FtsX-like permease family protein [Dissulfurispiraceae bacterium]|jgi:ABC-type lipoprotein release transport system permease subunit|nr:FtsX-like permease family protein [Dissulfurispiraceae bacterium]
MSWLNKQRNILDFTLSSLFRNKTKNSALVLVYAFVIFMLASVMLFGHAIRNEASIALQDAPEIVVQKLVAGRHDLIPMSYVEQIKKIRGTHSVKARIWGYYYDPVTEANYTLMVPDDLSAGQGNVIVGNGLSRERAAYKGDRISFISFDGKPVSLRIADILPYESELVSADLILVSIADFKRLFGMNDGYATDIVVGVRNKKEINTIAAKIVDTLPDTRPVTRDDILRTYDSLFNWRSGMVLAVLFGALAAFIIFAWDRASGLSAEERKEIGVLKAIGWETSDILLIKFWEGLTVSLASFFSGFLLAYAHIFFSSSSLFTPALKGWSVLYPEFKLTPFVDPYQIAVLFFLTVVPYTAATIVPSWRAATMDPDSVMREL